MPGLGARDRLVLALLGLTPALVVTGILLSYLTDRTLLATALIGTGLALGAFSTLLSHSISTLRSVGLDETGGEAYDELRYWGRLKASALLLSLVLVLVAGGLALFGGEALGYLDLSTSPEFASRVASFLTLVVVLNHTHAHYLSLRTPYPWSRNAAITSLHVLGNMVIIVLAVASAAVAREPLDVAGYVTLQPAHAPFVALATTFLLGLMLFVSRGLPSLYGIFTERREFYAARPGLAQARGVVVPAVIAFTLLFIVVLILLLLRVGTHGLRQPIQLGIVAFILVALGGSIAVSLRLARSQDRAKLLQQGELDETRTGRVLLFGSAGLASILLGLALVLYLGRNVFGLGTGAWIDIFSLGLLLGLGPYGFYTFQRSQLVRRLEERFPDFLRDIAASHKGGLTLNAAVAISARGEYGELTPEIRKMADQLSWNLSFDDVLKLLAQRVRTPLIERTAILITQAQKSGGSTTDVLLAAARDAREIKTLENERRTSMSLYTIIIYITFFVFLGIVGVLYHTFVPEILESTKAVQSAAQSAGSELYRDLDLEEYRGFYFLAALVQGIGNGLIAGLMQTGRALSGLRHSFFMVLAAYVTFAWLL